MTFRTKRDSLFLILFSSNSFLFVISLIVVLTTVSFSQWLIWVGWILLGLALVSWLAAAWFISYTFNKESILIRKGLFNKQIQYNQLIEAKETYYRLADLLNGERALSSKDGLILYYQTKVGMKTIKLSPDNKQSFIEELKKRVPKIKVNESSKKR